MAQAAEQNYNNIKPLIPNMVEDDEGQIIGKLDELMFKINQVDLPNMNQTLQQVNQTLGRMQSPASQAQAPAQNKGLLGNILPNFDLSNILWIGLAIFIVYWFFIKDK